MIITGKGGSPPLDAALAAVADALSGDERIEGEMWVVGTPGAGDWGRIVDWDGPLRALLVPHGLYRAPLMRRANECFCFSPDAERIGRGVAAEVTVPGIGHAGALAPPARGTPLGDVWWRRLQGLRGLPASCGVSWVDGRGSAAVAAACTAWAKNRAVVLLSTGSPPPPLDRGTALIARSALEVDEATSFVEESPPVARALASEGRRALAVMPSPADVAESLIQARTLGARDRSL